MLAVIKLYQEDGNNMCACCRNLKITWLKQDDEMRLVPCLCSKVICKIVNALDKTGTLSILVNSFNI